MAIQSLRRLPDIFDVISFPTEIAFFPIKTRFGICYATPQTIESCLDLSGFMTYEEKLAYERRIRDADSLRFGVSEVIALIETKKLRANERSTLENWKYQLKPEFDFPERNIENFMGKFNVSENSIGYVDHNGLLYSVPVISPNGSYRINTTEHYNWSSGSEFTNMIREIYGDRGENVIKMLKEAGYEKADFKIPHGENSDWNNLLIRGSRLLDRLRVIFDTKINSTRYQTLPEGSLDILRDEIRNRFRPSWVPPPLNANIGNYADHNGLFSFINPNGLSYIALCGDYTREIRVELERAGYRKDYFVIPHSDPEFRPRNFLQYLVPRIEFSQEELRDLRQRLGIDFDPYLNESFPPNIVSERHEEVRPEEKQENPREQQPNPQTEIPKPQVEIQSPSKFWKYTTCIAGALGLGAIVLAGYLAMQEPEVRYVEKRVPVALQDVTQPSPQNQKLGEIPKPPQEFQRDNQGKIYVRLEPNKSLEDQLERELREPDDKLLEFNDGILGDKNLRTITLDLTNRNFSLERGFVLEKGNNKGDYALAIQQVSDTNPLPEFYGNPGIHRWTGTTLSDALTGMSSFFKYSGDKKVQEIVKQRIEVTLENTFPGYDFDTSRIELVENEQTFTDIRYMKDDRGKYTDVNGKIIPSSIINRQDGRILIQQGTQIIMLYTDMQKGSITK